jgi:lipoprotein NlpD
LAPVVDSHWQYRHDHAAQHVVKRDESLYSIAFSYDIDDKQLIALNQLKAPYKLREGQVLRLKPMRSVTPISTFQKRASVLPVQRSTRRYSTSLPPVSSKTRSYLVWLWPLEGRVMRHFSPSVGQKGIDIAGKKGDSIRAASGGVVAYAGHGLSSYGNLIIIKHDQNMLTAYAHNERNLVHEGQRVLAGQTIAKAGVVDRRFWGVHFEMRHNGIPMNPLNYL